MADPEDAAAALTLADWRRRVADLYAEVRATARTDPEAAWGHWRETREQLFRTHPQSPVPAAARNDFRARHWRYDPAWRFAVQLVDAEAPVATAVPAAAMPALGFAIQLPMSVGE